MAKTKKTASGYTFKNLFAGMDNAKELTDKLKEIAKLEHRSVSMQVRVLLIDGINRYMGTKYK